jgi:hypothetical protein
MLDRGAVRATPAIAPDGGGREIAQHELHQLDVDVELLGGDRRDRRIGILQHGAAGGDRGQALIDDRALEGERHVHHRQAGDHRADLLDALLAQDVAQAGGVAIDHPHLGEALAQILEQGAVEFDHHHGLGRQTRVGERLRDRSGAGTQLDHHLARLPDDLAGERAGQRAR